MKTLRMMVAMVGFSLLVGTGIEARKAGAGARAGLPNLYKDLKLDSNASGNKVAQAVIESLAGSFLKNDANKARKTKDAFRVLLQKRPLWQNLGIDKSDANDSELIGEVFARKYSKIQDLMRNKKEVDRSSDKKAIAANKALDTVAAITLQEYQRQLQEWLKKNPSKQADFIRGAEVKSLSDFDFKVGQGSGGEERISSSYDDDDDDDFLYGKPGKGFGQEFQEQEDIPFQLDDAFGGQEGDLRLSDFNFDRNKTKVGDPYYRFVMMQSTKQGLYGQDAQTYYLEPNHKNLASAQREADNLSGMEEDYTYRIIGIQEFSKSEGNFDQDKHNIMSGYYLLDKFSDAN